ncbi:MAG: DNA internalization-related competence protein ComEC/Rec2 [Magnetococcales bacterium]|nr:DNA internalization-related competence protein ComEC/Rec2 [Magnetococcales bacterium]
MGLLLLAMLLGILLNLHVPVGEGDLWAVRGMVGLATYLAWRQAPDGYARWRRLILGLGLGLAAAAWEDWQALHPHWEPAVGKGGKPFVAMVVDRNDRDDSVQLLLEDFRWDQEEARKPGSENVDLHQKQTEVSVSENVDLNKKQTEVSGAANVDLNMKKTEVSGTANVDLNKKQTEVSGAANVDWHREQTEVPGWVQLTVYRQAVDLLPGDRIAGVASVRPWTDYRVPGVFSYGDFMRRQGVKASGYTLESPRVVEQTGQWRVNRMRQRISGWVTDHIPPHQQGLVEGILVGKRGRITEQQNETMRSAGLIHLVAISGSNLGLVAGWMFFGLRRILLLVMPLARRWDVKRFAAMGALLLTLGYAALAGWSVATQRAAIMIAMYLLAMALGRGNQSWRALGMAAILILLLQPHQLFQAGFQLSFLAVATLLVVTERKYASGWWNYPVTMLLSTVAIGCVLTPVTAHHFHQASPYGMLANIPAIPWVGVVAVPLGMIGLLLLPVSNTAGGWVLTLMGWSLELFDRWAVWISDLPGAWLRLPGPTLPGTVLMVLAMVGGVVGRGVWRRLGCLVLLVGGWFWPHPAPPPGSMQVTVLDVQQGQSVLLHAPTGGWSVIDAGGPATARFNVGESIISAYLWYQGVRKLERLVLSHPQQDHMAGATRLLRNFPIGELWLGSFPRDENERTDYRQILAMADRQGVTIRRFQTEVTLQADGLDFRILPPYPGGGARQDNDHSLVLEVTHGTQRVLFPGDIQKAGEKWLVRNGALVPVALTLAPHHGSSGSSTPDFVQGVHPDHVVFSVGRNNRYGFPKEDTLQRWAATKARIWRTDLDGTVVFRSDGRRLEKVDGL